ncbi:MFS transporter [Methanofollis fontis]|uniref:MFS transporter n=1 Tax=Methanofollis fontis TaxID=2052832 RepID=A0A483CWD5_9EURY|nr:MFS transporter [Methanofollis fontis]TAJ43946.1 MFS transporter [Methanofollis fontis]
MAIAGGKWGILYVVCMAVFIMVIDTTIMNVSITALVIDLDTTVPAIQAVIAIYALIMASFMLVGGRMQDVMGRRRAFLFGVVLYGIGTFVASMSWNIGVLLVGWSVLEGLGAVFMLPATATFITDAYEGADRAFAFGIWGGIGAAGAAFGPIIGGYLTSFYSWRWAFRLELLVVVVILLLSPLIRPSAPTASWREIDTVGTLLSFGGLSLIVAGILMLRSVTLWEVIPVVIGSGLVLLGIFYLWQRRRIRQNLPPLTDIALFGNRTFALGSGINAALTVVLAGFLFIIPIFLQSVTGVGAFETGLALLPMSLSVFALSIAGARLSGRIDPKYLVLAGSGAAIAGAVMMRGIFGIGTGIWDIVPGSVFFGLGVGLILSQATNITLSAASMRQQSDASGILNTAKQMGTSLGTALIGVVLLIVIFSGLVGGLAASGLAGDLTDEEIALRLQEWIERMKTDGEATVPDDYLPHAEEIADAAIGEGMMRSFDAITVILLLGGCLALFLPPARREGG